MVAAVVLSRGVWFLKLHEIRLIYQRKRVAVSNSLGFKHGCLCTFILNY